MKIEDVPVDKINVDERYRRDLGDIDSLASNIREMGLLQPIGVDPYYRLIFGYRRMLACHQLGWKRIPCVILKLESMLAGEYAENELRKQFTASERVAIGKAVEEELGKRKGQRTDLPAIAGTLPKGETVEIAAKRAGFSSADTYQRAATVVQKGSAALVSAMDQKQISPSAAAVIAHQPKADQARILAMPKDQQREVVRQIRKEKADREKDENRARDLRLFGGLYDSVTFIANFQEPAPETWAGLWRVSAYDFAAALDRAITFLCRLQKEHPNERKRPKLVTS